MSLPPEFRDIRSDLKLRLDGIGVRRDDAQQRYERELKDIESEESLLRELLKIEEKRANGHDFEAEPEAPSPPLHPGAQNRTEHEILDFLTDQLEHSHADIKDHLLRAGIGSADDPNFGRSVQGTLLSLRGRELVALSEKLMGTWIITQKGLTGD